MSNSPKPVGVIGGGSWGTTLAHLFAVAGNPVLLCVRRKEQAAEINNEKTNERYLPGYLLHEGIQGVTSLEKVARQCELIVMAVPSSSFRETSNQLGEYVQGDQIILSATKGLEQESFLRMTEILREETCCKKVGALSGPNLAREIMAGHPAATVIASRYDEVVQCGANVLASSVLRVYGNRDVIGTELAGALKNILAIAAGVATGLEMGDNAKALLITRGLAEISRLGVAAGANPLTFVGLTGVGDLMATCGSPLSRNHQVGRRLGEGQSLDEILNSMVMVAEGVKTTRVALALAERLGVEMPIAQGVHKVLYEGISAADAVEALMARSSTYELDGAEIG